MEKNKLVTKDKNISWEVLESRDILVIEPRIKVSVQRLRLPNGKIINDYYQISLPESVIMVARTTDGKFVMSKQYLHGLNRVSLVFPAGTMEKGESPLQAAQRELLEETGYASQEWILFSSLIPHTNYGCGKVHLFFAGNAKQIAKPILQDLEEMEIVLMDEEGVINAIKKNDIISMGSIAAFSFAKISLYDRLF